MRVLVPLVFLAVVAAACGGESSSHATPTAPETATRVPSATPAPTTQAVIPFTPVEEVLTPPPDIDTSGWLTYRDDANSFELKYPASGRVKQGVYSPSAVGPGARIDLPFQNGTTLEEKYLFIYVTQTPEDRCVPPALLSTPPPHAATPDVAIIHAGAAQFWRTHWVSAGGMHGTGETVYWTSREASCVFLDAVFYGANPSGFSTPPPPSDDAKESQTFAAILSTFRWTQP